MAEPKGAIALTCAAAEGTDKRFLQASCESLQKHLTEATPERQVFVRPAIPPADAIRMTLHLTETRAQQLTAQLDWSLAGVSKSSGLLSFSVDDAEMSTAMVASFVRTLLKQSEFEL